MVSDSHLIRFDTQSLKPVNTEFFPVCEPFKVCIRFTEEFQFHLFKFSCSESKIAWCDLISERLTDLSDTKWNLLTGCSLDILEINEDTLCSFRSQINGILRIFCYTLECLEHQVELTNISEVMLAAGWTADILFIDEVDHLFVRPAINGTFQFNTVILTEIFDQFVCSESFMTFLTIHQRI